MLSPAFREIAWTARTFNQTPSSLLEIRDYWTAREIDVMAARYIQGELTEREVNREKRDRVFWIKQFGGEVPEEFEPDYEADPEPRITVTESISEDDVISQSPLTRGTARG